MLSTNVRQTSIDCYREICNAGVIQKQTAKVLSILINENRPLNYRQISKLTGIELTSIGRCITKLKKAKQIESKFSVGRLNYFVPLN